MFPSVRRNVSTSRLIHKTLLFGDSLLSDFLQTQHPKRLTSRRYIWDQVSTTSTTDGLLQWRQSWSDNKPNLNADLTQDPTVRVNGFDLKRNEWTKLNRLRTGHGRSNYLMNKWGLCESAACDCGEPHQTMQHISDCCPLRGFNGGIKEILEVAPDAVSWLKNSNINF